MVKRLACLNAKSRKANSPLSPSPLPEHLKCALLRRVTILSLFSGKQLCDS